MYHTFAPDKINLNHIQPDFIFNKQKFLKLDSASKLQSYEISSDHLI